MALCKFQPGGGMFCSTPVENLFIEEYMPAAPADFVKVYLYGLMHCYYPDTAPQDLETMARFIQLPPERVREAFFYWQQQGLLRLDLGSEKPAVIYNILPRDARGFIPPQQDVFVSFNQQAQQFFNPRQLTPRELDQMHDWIRDLGFPCASALLIVEYCINMHGRDISINYMNTVAENWASEGLLSPDDIRAHLQQRRSEMRDVMSILGMLGIRKRSATDPELALYRKWTLEWGFDHAAIEAACAQSTAAQQPTMRYVDSILNSFRQNGLTTREQIESYLKRRSQNRNAALAIQNALGLKGSPSETFMQDLERWRAAFGYDVPVIELAARTVSRQGRRSADALENQLAQWHRLGLLSMDDIQNYLQRQTRLTEDLRTVLAHLGLDFTPNRQGRQSLELWLYDWQMPLETVLLGADMIVQSGVQFDRMHALHRLLSDWREQGVRDLQSARAAYQSKQQHAPRPVAQNTSEALRYNQRHDSLEDLYTEL